MTTYRCNCHNCTNKAISLRGDIYCAIGVKGFKTIYIEEGHSGTKEDPDVICCDYYTIKSQQAVLYEIII